MTKINCKSMLLSGYKKNRAFCTKDVVVSLAARITAGSTECFDFTNFFFFCLMAFGGNSIVAQSATFWPLIFVKLLPKSCQSSSCCCCCNYRLTRIIAKRPTGRLSMKLIFCWIAPWRPTIGRFSIRGISKARAKRMPKIYEFVWRRSWFVASDHIVCELTWMVSSM